MRIVVVKNFLSPETCEQLNTVCVNGILDGWMTPGYKTVERLTSRFSMVTRKYPEIVYQVARQVHKELGILYAPKIAGHGSDGIVVSYTPAGSDIYEHVDPMSYSNLATLRCNVITQAAKVGGELVIEDQVIPVAVGDLHCYLASDHRHRVTKVVEGPPRILWMFGAHVASDDWNSGVIAPLHI